jgi:tetratricopeptide (TPR) repeat protein
MAFSQKDAAACMQTADADLEIASCTRLLKSGSLSSQNRSAVYANRGYAWNAKGNYDRAIADYDEAIRLNPKNSISYSNRCVAWMVEGDFNRAIADCGEAIRLNPKNPFTFGHRCSAWARKREFDRAIADCNEAIRLDPKLAYAYQSRCTSWTEKGEYDRAIADCDEAIRLDPKLATAYNGRGHIWLLKGDFDRAMADYNEAIRLNPELAATYGARGAAWDQKGDFDRALADLNENIRLQPNDSGAFTIRAQVWRDKGDFDRAMADIDEAIRLQLDEFLKPYGFRGQIWRLKGDLDRALADHDEDVRLFDPRRATIFQNAGAYVARGDTLRYMGNFSRALADYDEALRRAPDFISALTGRGLTYEKMGDLARAHVEFEKALASQSSYRAFQAKDALETARAHLAALASGAPLPVIPAAPSKAASATSIPTPEAAVPVVAPGSIAPHSRRVALVIGNSGYRNVPELLNPKRDADVVAESLKAIGFETVTVVDDATHEALVDALRRFADEAEKADWALVYYAGHGIQVGGVNYLIPVEAKLEVDRDVQFETVPLEQVLAAVEQAKKLKLIVLDACRNDPFASQMRRTAAPEVMARGTGTAGATVATRAIGRGLGPVEVAGATLVVYSAKDGQTALDGEGANSPFAVAFVQRIATPGVEINKVFRLVRDDVMEATAGRQEPYTYGSLPGREDFFFVTK